METAFGVLLVFCTAYLLRDARWVELVAGVGLVALLPALLGPVLLHRFDLWPALLVSASLLSLGRGRSRFAGAFLGLAVAAKAYAAAVVLPALSAVDREEGRLPAWKAGAAALVAGLLVTVPLALVAPGGVASSIQRQADRPLQIESVGASLLLVAGAPTVEFASGSWSLTGPDADAVGTASTAVGLAALVAVWIASWRWRRRLGSPALAYAVCVALVLVFAKVASPQFLVWLVPLVAVVRSRAGLVSCGLVALACVLTQLVYPARYEELVAHEGLPVALLVARNALLVLTAAVLVLALARRLQRQGVS